MACKTNNKQILLKECGSAPEIQVSWLSYGDIKIWDTYVYERSGLAFSCRILILKTPLVLIGYLYV